SCEATLRGPIFWRPGSAALWSFTPLYGRRRNPPQEWRTRAHWVRQEREEFGGARGSRTPDLLNAIQALSQLSYGPTGPPPAADFDLLKPLLNFPLLFPRCPRR